jgi:hypothetical protein
MKLELSDDTKCEKKTKVMRISRQATPMQNMKSQTQTENVEYFKYLGSTIANDA